MKLVLGLLCSVVFAQQNQIDWNTQIKNRPATITSFDWNTQITNRPQAVSFNSPYYNFAARTPGGSLIIGSNTITWTPVPPGLNGADSGHYLWISGGTGTAEACLVTGGTAVAGASTGTTIMACANTHSGAWTVASATAGIQEAVTAVQSAGGGVALLPAGSLTIHATITVTANDVTISGVGVHATQIACGAGSYDCIGTTAAYTRIANLSIVGTGRTGGYGINADNAGSIVVEDVNISHCFSGVRLWVITIAHLNRMYITFSNSSGVGIYMYGGNDQTIQNIVMDNDPLSMPFAGIEIDATGGAFLDNLDIIHASNGLLLSPPPGSDIIALNVSHAWFDSGGNGINILPTGAGGGGTQAVTNFRCIGCWTASNSGNGVNVSNLYVSDIAFIGLTSFNNGQHGVSMGSEVSISDSKIASNSQSGSAGYDNIVVAAGATNFRIQNNQIGGNYLGMTEFAAYDVLLLTGAGDNFIVSGNTLTTPVTATLVDAATGTHAVVRDNIGYNPVGAATITVGTGTTTYRAGHSPEIVSFVGGTCTNISRAGAIANATSTGTTAVTVPLPPNGTVVSTCSAAPTGYKDIQ